MGRFTKYQSYKDSGVEWIGKIPLDWNLSKIKYQTFINRYSLGESTAEDYEIEYIDISSVDQNGNILNTEKLPFDKAPSRARRIVKDGDTIVSTVRTYLKAIASIRDAPENLICSTGFAVLSPKHTIDPIYLSYLMRSTRYVDEIVKRSTGVSYPATTATEIGSLECILPDLETQKSIGIFLDDKTFEIDSLIADKEKLIVLLEEKRQVKIIELITKGLNPNVKMKDSSVGWIDRIPEHWEEKKIKYLFYEVNERNFEEDAELLSLFTSIGVRPRSEMEDRGNKAQTVINYKQVKKGDIVVNKLLAWMGAIGISNYDGVTSPDYDVYRPINEKLISNKYYHYYFRSHYFKGDCYKFGRGIMMMRWRTYPEQFKSIPVPVPPIEEQIEIANYIDEKTKDIDLLITETESAISKLKEYRQALIYEAVTGKIDVREYKKVVS